MSSLMDKLKKNSTIKESSTLDKSKFFTDVDECATGIPAINIALSGSLDGGLKRGTTLICGPSRHFKSLFSLIMAESYLKKHKDAVCLFYDSEFGTPTAYFESVGIDPSRVIHSPITDMEQLKFDLMAQLNEIKRGDKVVIVIDSLGNIASKKEVDDATEGKSVADMSRAKQMKSIFRMITPHLTIKDIPLIGINHIYMEQGLYPKAIVSGGTGILLSSDNVWILGRQQDKDGTELLGYNFIINIEKSRHVREKSKIPVNVKFDGGLSKYSGLLDIAVELGAVVKPSVGWFSKVDLETGEVDAKKYRSADTDTKEFWDSLLTSKKFKELVEGKFKVTTANILSDDELESEIEKTIMAECVVPELEDEADA